MAPKSHDNDKYLAFSCERLLDLISQCQDAIESQLPDLEGLSSGRRLVALAAGRRSGELVEAFRLCTTSQLWLIAPAITRLQLDSALRLYALELVDKGEHLAQYILQGCVLSKYKLKDYSRKFYDTLTVDDKRLTDSFLYQQLSKVYSPKFDALNAESPSLLDGHSGPNQFLSNSIGDIYQDGNKFIHLSRSHIMEMFVPQSLTGGNIPELRPMGTGPGEEIKKAWCSTMLFVSDVLRQQIEGLSIVAEDEKP